MDIPKKLLDAIEKAREIAKPISSAYNLVQSPLRLIFQQ
jgi:hypothetical protein